MNKLFISPHNDDAVLFGAFTLMREKPLVLTVTDAYLQAKRGENITADQRWQEDVEAMKVLDCPIIRGGVSDDFIDEWNLDNLFRKFTNFDVVYAPAIQGGNPCHDFVGQMAKQVFGDKVKQYCTYSGTELYTTGTLAIEPNEYELAIKNEALACYQSQINLPATAPHFEAVRGKSEWFI